MHNITSSQGKFQKIRIVHIAQYLCVYQVINVKLQATTKLFIVAIFYQKNPIQNTTVNIEITTNLLNLVPRTNLKLVRNSC